MIEFSSYISADIQTQNTAGFYKEVLNKILDDLPEKKIIELIGFAMFIKERINDVPIIRAVPATGLNGLTGIVNWGGDALDDTERLFEERNE